EGLCPEDEPFLEAALGDRSKLVRAAAAALLARLPQSALAARVQERAAASVTVFSSPGALCLARLRIEVTLPAECDAAMVRDGIEPKLPPEYRPFGQRGWWLAQVLGMVPPTTWSTSTPPRDLLAVARKNEAWDALLAGWCRAAVLFQDA